jgi:hypothetical protein
MDHSAVPIELAMGNSQIVAYVAGHRLAQAAGVVGCDVHGLEFRGERYEPYVQPADDGLRFHPAVVSDTLAAIRELHPTNLVLAILGSFHWIAGVINDPRPFDFLVPVLPQHPMSPQAELIPYDLMLRRIRADLDWQFNLVRLAQGLCKLPIFVIEAPPPVENADLMLRGVNGDFRARMEQFGCPTTSFRYKTWWIWTHIAKCFCAELGAHFIEGPPETRDAYGFLDERYYLDGVHGTAEYGAVIVGEVAKAKRRMGLADV